MLLITAAFVSAEAKNIYQWVDDNGVTHFGDSAPTDESAWEILSDASTSNKLSVLKQRKAFKITKKVPAKSKKQQKVRKNRYRAQLAKQKYDNEKACFKAKERLEKIAIERRRGYSVARGQRLAEQRTQQEERRRFYCNR